MSDPLRPRLSSWTFDNRTVARSALFCGLVVALQLVGLGSIPVPNLSGAMTTLLVPVILGTIVAGPIVGLLAGLTMGLVYLLLPATAAFGPITLVTPRILMVLVVWVINKLLTRAPPSLAAGIAAAAGSLVNTVFAVGIAIALNQVPRAIVVAVLPQALIEIVGCAILVPLLTTALRAANPNSSATR